jgi:hypothetical protein
VDLSWDEIRRRIAEVGPGLHGAGTFSARTLEAIAQAAGRRQIRNSVETGSGASTLLFSHLSARHTVRSRRRPGQHRERAPVAAAAP